MTDKQTDPKQSDLAQTQRADEAEALCGVLRGVIEGLKAVTYWTPGAEREDAWLKANAALAATPAEAGERMRRLEAVAKAAKERCEV